MNSIVTSQKVDIEGNQHRSQLPQPKKFLALSNCLSEISESKNNIWCNQSCSLPKSNLKHKITSSHGEPEPKRKTLMEKTEVPRLNESVYSKTQPHIKAINHARSKSGLAREKLLLSSTNTKYELNCNTSDKSLSRSVGPRSHPINVNPRPQSSFSQSTNTRSLTRASKPHPFLSKVKREDFVGSVSNEFKREEWDVEGRIKNMEVQFLEMQETIKDASMDKKGLEESMIALKARNAELETNQCQLILSNKTMQSELDSMRQKAEMSQQNVLDTTKSFNDHIRSHQLEIEDIRRQNRNEVEKIRRDNSEEIDKLSRQNRDQIRELERRTVSENDEKLREIERQSIETLEDEKKKRQQEVEALETKYASEIAIFNLKIEEKNCEIQKIRNELKNTKDELNQEIILKANALSEHTLSRQESQKIMNEKSSTIQNLEHILTSLRARIQFLESGSKAQSDSFAEMEARLEEAQNSARVSKAKLIKEESLRRILFNQVQELKGNIRVMCRIRPTLEGSDGEAAKFKITDADKESKELEIVGKEERSCFGTSIKKIHTFTFDRIFGPDCQNQEIFEEISQLVQSALDGYNVCIFCYGQTGSGKTYTMSSPDGVIPRATQQIYETATNLKEKGWNYSMEGSFVEVYNEEIHDLLSDSKDSNRKRHEIRHDDQKKQTIVLGLNTVTLDSPSSVDLILNKAAANRTVAATKSNERSSRSHSVFMLKIIGENTITNERCEGNLNLVDLAGSERLKNSGAEGDRMKETQSINKSLSCLGDVIGSLGHGKGVAHIPYRNSKLTYLLQYSLGGNSKTLMFVMASPLEVHLGETITSLKFATKVHNTHIGSAKKTKKCIGDS